MLVASELAANATIHGGGLAFRIHVLVDGPRLRIEIDDPSEALPVRTSSPWSGMTIVDRLCTSWGVAFTATGKRVWCELATGVPHGVA